MQHYENVEISKERETSFNIYHKLNQDMISYETEKYNSWVSESLLISTSLMVQPVLFVKEIGRISSSKTQLKNKKKVINFKIKLNTFKFILFFIL